MFKKENGITLVALVVTIIVLLILAGVSITMISGDDGIATRASDAASKTDIGNVEDAINLAVSTAKTEHYAKYAEGTVTNIKPALTGTDINNALSGYQLTGSLTDVIENDDSFDVKETGASEAGYTAKFAVNADGAITGVTVEAK